MKYPCIVQCLFPKESSFGIFASIRMHSKTCRFTQSPISIMVDTFGTDVISESCIEAAVKEVFYLMPVAMIRDLCLYKSVYSELARYGT